MYSENSKVIPGQYSSSLGAEIRNPKAQDVSKMIVSGVNTEEMKINKNVLRELDE
jgi:hypothetical protein